MPSVKTREVDETQTTHIFSNEHYQIQTYSCFYKTNSLFYSAVLACQPKTVPVTVIASLTTLTGLLA